MTNVIEVQNLRKSYGEVEVLSDVNIKVGKGEIFGLLGGNGAGKSTTVDCILGMKKYDSGSIKILGMDPAKDRKKLFQKVAVQFQQSSFPDKIKVYEQCKLTASLYNNSRDWLELLEVFGLKKLKNKYVEDLSGGERQKLAVLLTLIPSPEVIFLDELTTGLDTKIRREVWKYLRKVKESGVTIFLISHFMDEVEHLCDYVSILQNGTITVSGTVSALIDGSPHNNLEESYIYYTQNEEGNDNEGIFEHA